ncbi:15194_t:CDS:2 [Racocetra persica]|uniref:15194_t:CDS:1 n=1 Tax=Racocetra persica TaxID=160502 RepID=A0ACA9KQJ7_9GLOM|nr:15194_t:CDS:2 [Racocetra persica]
MFFQKCAILGNHLKQKCKHKEIAELCFKKYEIHGISKRLLKTSKRDTSSDSPYIESIPIVCAFGIDISELEKLVGNDLVDEISSYKSRIPSVWTKGLKKYFENALDKVEKNFKLAIQEEIEGSEENKNKFRLYCKKVLMEL